MTIMGNLAIFASGSGTNANAIMNFFDSLEHQVVLVITNRREAGVLKYAANHEIPATYLRSKYLKDDQYLLRLLEEYEVDGIALAGYLKMIPRPLIESYQDRIWNIHPSLLPEFGGSGMYGLYVHEKVLEEGTHASGITIHYVNEKYDQGEIILQAQCEIAEGETVSTLVDKIRELEHRYYPRMLGLLMDRS